MSKQTDIPLGHDFALELEQFHSETRARPEELAAIRRRLRAVRSAQEQKRPPLRLLSIGTVSMLAAAGLMMVMTRPSEPGIQQIALSAEQWSEVAASDDVLLGFSGQGDLQSTGTVHDIDWRTGRLNVSVTPNQDINLTVSTPEALVSVVGTVFEVRRDALGTTVSVARGKVEVLCNNQSALYLTSEQTHTCLPTTALGLLNRALDLKADDPDAALEAIAMGLEGLDETSSDYDDLHYWAADIHHGAERSKEALHSAQAALSADATYASEASRIAAMHGMVLGGCELSAAHLSWLAENDEATAEELALLAQCTIDTDPATARQLLEAAEAQATDQGLKERIRRRLNRLAAEAPQ